MRPRKSFTLVELLVVIVLIGMLLLWFSPTRPPYDHPLHTALRNGDVVEATRLIENGLAKVNERGRTGRTPLHYAATGGHKDVAALLIEKGAEINARDTWGLTPLDSACFPGEVVANLGIKKGANVHGSRDVAELLIENGADVNAKNNCLETPLHQAAHWGQIELVRLLLSKGADLNAKTRGGATPLSRAEGSGHGEISALLIAKGATR